MAGRHRSLWRLIAALTLAVVLLHWAALAWLCGQWVEPSVLRPMATPLFTRTLAPSVAVRPHSQHTAAIQKAGRSPTSQAGAVAELPPSEPVAEVPAPEPVVAQASDAAAEEVAPKQATPVPPQAPAAPVDTWPANTRLSYEARGYFRGPLWGDAQVQWQRDGERYQVQLEVSFGWLAHLSMTSQGQVTPAQLMPDAFEEQTSTHRRHLRFTPQEMVLMNGTRLPRPDGVQDTASQFVELSHRFANATAALAVGQSVQFWLARPGGADVWTYDVVELETLTTPRLGSVQAFHLKPRPLANPRGPITAEMWFAPTLQYLPVRIKVTLNEQTWIDLLVDKIEQSVAPPPPDQALP